MNTKEYNKKIKEVFEKKKETAFRKEKAGEISLIREEIVLKIATFIETNFNATTLIINKKETFILKCKITITGKSFNIHFYKYHDVYKFRIKNFNIPILMVDDLITLITNQLMLHYEKGTIEERKLKYNIKYNSNKKNFVCYHDKFPDTPIEGKTYQDTILNLKTFLNEKEITFLMV